MKRLLLTALVVFLPLAASAQTMADDTKTWARQWKHAFSEEGRQAWKPEFTLRYYAGYPTDGPALTGGIRIDEKRAIGLMLRHGDMYNDANPGDYRFVSLGLYLRRYYPIGKKNVFAWYSDLSAGVGYKYMDRPTLYEDVNPLKFYPVITWEPGIRIRFWRNAHLFLGPSISTTHIIGLHVGIGM